MARGAAARGKRIAFGDGTRIRWDLHAEPIYRGNPNIAKPGEEFGNPEKLEWVAHYKGNRKYNSIDRDNRRWIWNEDFRPVPGEMFFTKEELKFGASHGNGFVIIEPALVVGKPSVLNKDWPLERYNQVADGLRAKGLEVAQFLHGSVAKQLATARKIRTADIRLAIATLAHAKLFIGAEGGMTHAAAAVGVPAVALCGSWINPKCIGYETNIYLTGGATYFCGAHKPCDHCRATMAGISVDQVVASARHLLQ